MNKGNVKIILIALGLIVIAGSVVVMIVSYHNNRIFIPAAMTALVGVLIISCATNIKVKEKDPILRKDTRDRNATPLDKAIETVDEFFT